jgi:hypothetical protein
LQPHFDFSRYHGNVRAKVSQRIFSSYRILSTNLNSLPRLLDQIQSQISKCNFWLWFSLATITNQNKKSHKLNDKLNHLRIRCVYQSFAKFLSISAARSLSSSFSRMTIPQRTPIQQPRQSGDAFCQRMWDLSFVLWINFMSSRAAHLTWCWTFSSRSWLWWFRVFDRE